jgi:hypothetical protein
MMSIVQSYYRQINYQRLLLLIFIFSLIMFISFFVVFAFEEGGEANTAYYTAQWIFRLISFPGFLFSNISFLNNLSGLILSITIGVLFYSLLVEILIIKYRYYKLKRSA